MLLEKLDTLSEREQKVLAMLYGQGKQDQKTPEEVAAHFGTSPERVWRLEESAFRKLSQSITLK